ncbi:putative RNA-directed DNA polymerase from transposon X-element [Trichonephila clavipes]|uniref:Putative RNA-directed DNA polymerase from transposon X-element n=1 Tax=Trichonephila clavipes TaxID=2585209 RepID=A0A8X6VSX7_TRICX|nr:putative RNA-directed DNA polymerase from transposon X-element [Trichonephila clavipes]
MGPHLFDCEKRLELSMLKNCQNQNLKMLQKSSPLRLNPKFINATGYGNFGKELGALWEKHIEALSPEDNTLWRKSSLLRKPFRPIPPLQGALGSTAITPIEKAEVIADSLQEQFEPNHVAGREDFDQRIHEEVENFLATPHGQEIEPTTPTEVLTYVQRIKPKKSPGLDQISNLHQLLRVTKLIHSGFGKHDATGIRFLDIAKAFDKIWHDGLLIKLIRLDFPAPLIKSIHCFLTHRSFRVRVDRILSPPLDQSEAPFRKEV